MTCLRSNSKEETELEFESSQVHFFQIPPTEHSVSSPAGVAIGLIFRRENKGSLGSKMDLRTECIGLCLLCLIRECWLPSEQAGEIQPDPYPSSGTPGCPPTFPPHVGTVPWMQTVSTGLNLDPAINSAPYREINFLLLGHNCLNGLSPTI